MVFKRLLNVVANNDDINFWRTQNKNEVDFVIEKLKKAYEVKINKKKFLVKKYKLFIENYSDFDLSVIDLEESMFLWC